MNVLTNQARDGIIRLRAALFAILGLIPVYSNFLQCCELKGYFKNESIQLYYNIDLPKNHDNNLTLIIIAHGSGQSKAKDNRRFAKPLIKAGYAVMTYDRRGVGRSGGTYTKAWSGLADSASDLVAAVEFVKNCKNLIFSKIGLYGQSQSGWVIPMAASQTRNVDFMVLLSGPVVSTATVGHYSKLVNENPQMSLSAIREQLNAFQPPAGDVSILEQLRKLKIPGLWVFGARDRVQPTLMSVELLERLKQNHNPAIDVLTYDRGDHALRDVHGQAIDYRTDVINWLKTILRQ